MVLKLDEKKNIVAEVAEVASKALSAIAVDYRGLKVSDMTDFRSKARKSGVYLRVVRNTLARRALQGTDFACLEPALRGPIILAFSLEDPGAVGRLISEFLEKSENITLKAIAIGGQLLEPSRLKDVASLPTLDQALALLMSAMLAPINKLAYALTGAPTKLACAFSALAQKQQ